jgi:hypothetical protein
MGSKYSIRKYNGDDEYSWAIFLSKHIKGLGKQIFYGDAQPIITGCSKQEATHHKKGLERRINDR